MLAALCVSSRCVRAEIAGVYRPEVDHEWELIRRSREKHMVKWSTNENGKLLPLVGLVQVHAGERGGQVMMDAPCLRCCWYDQKKYQGQPPSSSSIHHHNRQTDVCRSPASTENCLCVKLPLGWEILFICCTSPIMFLSPSRLLVLFSSVNQLNTDFRSSTTCALLPKRASWKLNACKRQRTQCY